MKPHTYSGEAIVLGRKNYGEADRILSVYSKEYGKIAVMAKGVRRPKSKKRGHLEIFNRAKIQLINGKGLSIITEAEVIDDFKEIRTSLRRISLAYYFSEVIGRITHEGESNFDIYNLILENLESLKKTNELKKLRLDFIRRLLVIMGYWPLHKKLDDPDSVLEEVIERQMYSKRVGKIISFRIK